MVFQFLSFSFDSILIMFIILVRSQVIGIWDFELGANTGDRSETCGYLAPDQNVQHFIAYNHKLQPKRRIQVRLLHSLQIVVFVPML